MTFQQEHKLRTIAPCKINSTTSIFREKVVFLESSASVAVHETGEPDQRLKGFTTDDTIRKLSLSTISIRLRRKFEWQL